MQSSTPDSWDVEADQTNNPQIKRKEASSPTPGHTKKKTPRSTTDADQQDAGDALTTATKSVEYASELAQSLALEYYHEEHIGPCLSKVAKALDSVSRALSQLFKERNSAPAAVHTSKRDASTNTDPTDNAVHQNSAQEPAPTVPATKTKTGSRGKNRQSMVDSRTPNYSAATAANSAPTIALQPPADTDQANPPEAPFTLVKRQTKKFTAPTTQPSKRVSTRPAAVLVKSRRRSVLCRHTARRQRNSDRL